MRFLTLEDCSDSELHCLYHDPERTVTLLHPRTACSLQIYAPEEDHHVAIGTYQSRRPNDAHSWWQQSLSIVVNQLLGTANSLVKYAVSVVSSPQPDKPSTSPVHQELIRHHLVNLRSVIPHHEALDEEEHIQSIQPLPSPWSFPSSTHYREARRGYIEYLSKPLIAELVTLGLMQANDAGIRWKHLDQYVLVTAESEGCDSVTTEQEVYNRTNRPRLEKLDPRAYRRERTTRPSINSEPNNMEEKPATPIIELESASLAVGEKRVRLHPKRTCAFIGEKVTVVQIEDLEDNEGKCAEMHRRKEAERAKKRRTRSSICWDSDRGL